MDLKEFYREVKKIVLFPGSVEELNALEEISSSDRQYELMPIKGEQKYLTGVIIPGLKEFQEQINILKGGIETAKDGLEDFLTQDIDEDDEDDFKELGKMGDLVESLFKKMIGNPALMRRDIRLKAKQIGANGLVHVQPYNKEQIYMGVPVKLSKTRAGDL